MAVEFCCRSAVHKVHKNIIIINVVYLIYALEIQNFKLSNYEL